ncbi:WYL domain-containing protein [Paenibacillus sp. KACC 21273]|uniref:WYL domain-containing protein n=1 Tax=Paenibacillus sp. KACC 21273 TaxID=3025665 RepID=UPI002365E5CB|nr:WYL domain-containing protein [Paenibacillus sp. KACC 21273]WDF52816.1 WYL domain-containing protein [Paenibacillus sp. KACC 21273]
MNLFEKIFSYQLTSVLEEHGTYTLTTQERIWLKTMLDHPIAGEALSADLIAKIIDCIPEEQQLLFQPALVEKAGSHHHHMYHTLIQPLRKSIRQQECVSIQYENKHGQVTGMQPAVPWRLEFSMVKREWYLIWYNLRSQVAMTTRLIRITQIEDLPAIESTQYNQIQQYMEQKATANQHQALIEILPQYNIELSRILHAFSCFEKQVKFSEDTQTYRIHLVFDGSETHYVLSKLRSLGKRVVVLENNYLQWRLFDASTKALSRYGIDQI